MNAQNIKNPSYEAVEAVRNLQATHKIALTGTIDGKPTFRALVYF